MESEGIGSPTVDLPIKCRGWIFVSLFSHRANVSDYSVVFLSDMR